MKTFRILADEGATTGFRFYGYPGNETGDTDKRSAPEIVLSGLI